MVLGTGLMASVFASFANDDRFRVIAAGVSNSGEKAVSAFRREQHMVNALPTEGGCVVYLSTCSIFDPTLDRSAYVEHKRAMEALILSRFPDTIVLRLPNILGRSQNPNTLLNHFQRCLLTNAPIEVQSKACRYVMDRYDLTRYAPLLLEEAALRGCSVNVCYDTPVPVPQLLKILEQVLNTRADVRAIDKGACYSVENDVFRTLLTRHGLPQPNAADLMRTIRGHYGRANDAGADHSQADRGANGN